MFVNNEIWLQDKINLLFCKDLTGSFYGFDTQETRLDLHLNENGALTGKFSAEGTAFIVRGCVSHDGIVCGFLLEPASLMPVALLRLTLGTYSVAFESFIPEISDLIDQEKPEQVLLRRMAFETPANKDLGIGA